MKGGKDSLPQLLARGLSPTKTHAPGWGPGQIVVLGTQAFHPCPETVLSTLKSDARSLEPLQQSKGGAHVQGPSRQLEQLGAIIQADAGSLKIVVTGLHTFIQGLHEIITLYLIKIPGLRFRRSSQRLLDSRS